MAIAERKILFPLVEPTIPVEKIREAVRIVAAEARKRAESSSKGPKESSSGAAVSKGHNH
jgi:hypothetical protein